MPSATVGLTKETFLQDEPIEVKLVLTNFGPREIELNLHYPNLQTAFGFGGFELKPDKANLKLKPQPILECRPKVPIIKVPSGGEWTTRVYLQRLMEQPKPGTYQLPYTLDLAYVLREPDGELKEKLLSVKGEFRFTVSAPDPAKLDRALETYIKRAEKWEHRAEAVEALGVVDNPAVVPHLVRLMERGMPDEGLAALARFPKDTRAQAAILGALKSERFLDVHHALRVLAGWKYALSPAQVRGLLGRNNPQITGAVESYIDALDNEDLKKLLRP